MYVDKKSRGNWGYYTVNSFKVMMKRCIVSSHVIEHFIDPIKTLAEWARVARKYIFIICPHKDRTFDKDRPVTPISELVRRNRDGVKQTHNAHHSVWRTEDFVEFVCSLGYRVIEVQNVDDKVGNGFTVVIEVG